MIIHNQEQLKDKELLVFCPTRSRVDRASEMIMSFHLNTSASTGILFGLDNDDPELFKYEYLFNGKFRPLAYTVNSYSCNTFYINAVYKDLPNYKYYSTTNDDFLYMTKYWDTILMQAARNGIAYGNDGNQGRNMPTTSVIDGNIVRAVDWLQMPTTRYLYGDCAWKALGEATQSLKYVPEVLIKHNHFLFDKSIKQDDTYKKTNSQEMYELDDQAFHLWLKSGFYEDCLKIKKLIRQYE